MISSFFLQQLLLLEQADTNMLLLSCNPPKGQGPLLNYSVLLVSSSNKALNEQPVKGNGRDWHLSDLVSQTTVI